MKKDYEAIVSHEDPKTFGVSVCTVDGQIFNLGDALEKDKYVTMQQVANIIGFLVAQEENDPEDLLQTYGCEPSGKPYSYLELKDDKMPHNPMINSGALMSCAKIFQGMRAD